MSLSDTKRVLQWNVVMEALADAGVDAELVAMVEHARAVDMTVHMIASTLIGGADTKQAKNYIKVEMVGMLPPFDRMYIELARPGGKTSHELRELLRGRLEQARNWLAEGGEDGRDAVLRDIEAALSAEAP